VASAHVGVRAQEQPQDVREIGALLGVSAVLEGTVQKIRGSAPYHRSIHPARTGDQPLVGAVRPEARRRVRDPGDEIARHHRDALRPRCSPRSPTPRRDRLYRQCGRVWLVPRGRYSWNKRSAKACTKRSPYFEQAIAADPQYALATRGSRDGLESAAPSRRLPSSASLPVSVLRGGASTHTCLLFVRPGESSLSGRLARNRGSWV